MKTKHLSTSQNRRLKVKAIKKNTFSELQKLILPLLVVSLLYVILSANLTT